MVGTPLTTIWDVSRVLQLCNLLCWFLDVAVVNISSSSLENFEIKLKSILTPSSYYGFYSRSFRPGDTDSRILQNRVDQIQATCYSSPLFKAGLIRSGSSDLCPFESWTCPRMECFSHSVSVSLSVLKQPHSKKNPQIVSKCSPL